ncbi:geranylgeranyl transferase type-2 subunit alpha [Aedes aegypti]|uniref:Geranylgeranyl transferase type-2 subunit alpha n=1 Tax=Aedes aegypti TaxID=7159 RepID=A0A1S4EWC7_AEDAE|nr:geranylgeranyl transferase type-2 subunit alpha [Aedes aegypti]
MHGRLKVRTSAEEAARKQKEREQKAKAFRAGMGRILMKKVTDELDEEMMQLTAKILAANPDVATLWNLRRRCILKFAEADPENQKIFEDDLRFTEMCLQVNPKSYCAWHHRCWCLENSPSPDWQKEVDLCTKYLKLDERNFHCWDYRRYVTEKANVPPSKELEFCTEKIHNNFSNYSSWHYRSKLLPILYPNKEDPSRPISEEKLLEELELVLTAAFTDPNDSSAWFYQRWLLGYSRPELDLAAFRLDSNRKLAVITFTRPVNLKHSKTKLDFSFSEEMGDVEKWQSASPEETYSVTWFTKDFNCVLPDQAEYSIAFTDEDGKCYKLEVQKPVEGVLVSIKKPKCGYEFGSAVLEVLKAQLANCEHLLEYEPDSKWTLLTAALLMKAIDRSGNHAKILENLEKLQTVDPMRKGYYQDMMNKWSIEIRLECWLEGEKPLEKLDLSELRLNRLAYEQYLAVADEIDLTGNELLEGSLAKFCHFVFCRKLTLTKGGPLAEGAELKMKQLCVSLDELKLVE